MLDHVVILRKTSTEDKKTIHSDNNKKMKKNYLFKQIYKIITL